MFFLSVEKLVPQKSALLLTDRLLIYFMSLIDFVPTFVLRYLCIHNEGAVRNPPARNIKVNVSLYLLTVSSLLVDHKEEWTNVFVKSSLLYYC